MYRTYVPSWSFPRHVVERIQHEALLEEIVVVAHRISMVYCSVADVKVNTDNPRDKILTFNNPYEF